MADTEATRATDDGLAVIGAGLPRSGTSSFQVALEMLGFRPCYHDPDIARHPDEWYQLATANVVPDWRRMFAEYRAISLLPVLAASDIHRDVRAAFPDTKVVLTVRDVDGWIRSIQTLHEFFVALGAKEAMQSGPAQRWRTIMSTLTWDALGDLDDTDALARLFRDHTDRITADEPSGRLLVFDVREGWEPLCGFLGVDVPTEPFPRINESAFLETALTLDGPELLATMTGSRTAEE